MILNICHEDFIQKKLNKLKKHITIQYLHTVCLFKKNYTTQK